MRRVALPSIVDLRLILSTDNIYTNTSCLISESVENPKLHIIQPEAAQQSPS